MRISQVEFSREIANKSTPTLVSFGAEWSGTTEMLFSILEHIESDFSNQVDFCLIDIEANPNLADQWGIAKIPTTLIIHKGEVVDYFTGLMPKGKIKKRIKTICE